MTLEQRLALAREIAAISRTVIVIEKSRDEISHKDFERIRGGRVLLRAEQIRLIKTLVKGADGPLARHHRRVRR
jgi:hypothetical protein